MTVTVMAAMLAMPALAGAHDPLHPQDPGHFLTGPSAFAHMDLLASYPSGEPGARPTNSDIAFWGKYAYVGNYNGFRIFDISTPSGRLVSDVRCVGAQGDPSVVDTNSDGHADLLVLSVDRTMTGPDCSAVPTPNTYAGHSDPAGWEGLRLFDVSDPANPKFITGVYQDCGSHTNTLLPQEDGKSVYVLNSSYPLRPGPTCGPERGPASGRDPLHGVVQVVKIPFDDPASAEEIAELPVNYPGDPDNKFTPSEHGLSAPGVLVDGMRACHDIAVFTSLKLVAGACAEQAQVWRIGPDGLPDTENPIWVYDQDNVDFWHSATFSWDGKVTNFIDESFGGGCPTTTVKTAGHAEEREYETGNMFFLDTDTGGLLSEFRIQRATQGDAPAYCSSHLGNVVPARDRYLLVNAYYRGGSSVIDFTDPTAPREIAYSDLENMDTWSAYWYERNSSNRSWIATYGNDGVHTPNTGYGFEVFRAFVGKVKRVGLKYLNPQVQEQVVELDRKAKQFKTRKQGQFAKGRALKGGKRPSSQAFRQRELD